MENIKTFTKWVAVWGTATSITERKEAFYAKDITLRYPIRIGFCGNKLRFHFSNLTGTDPIKITKAFVSKNDTFTPILFNGTSSVIIGPGKALCSDETIIDITAGDTIEVSLYFADFTQMNAGTLVTGPLSSGKYCYGDFCDKKDFPIDLSRNTNWYYFLNTIDIFTEEKNKAFICYGDSITAQSWPDYVALKLWEKSINNISIIRRAVCGTRILRQYDCITYAAYGLKGETRFPIECQVAGADKVLIQHGINDIIHPVGVDVNRFRPWEDLPSVAEMIEGVERFYLDVADKNKLKCWSGTLLPIYGWRTYAPFRDELRNAFNEWLRNSDRFEQCVDFDRVVRNPQKVEAFAEGFDSGDHLHPSEKAYMAMADAVVEKILLHSDRNVHLA
ncbi:MAG: GDSL-type esterase/lipase family protein [Treponema sp.]|nr:GDSL-type esterase/lipase family protein [Treponema sp.]